MKFRIVAKKNPQDKQAPIKYYANAVNLGAVTTREIAEAIAGRSSLTRGDIENVLENFLDELPFLLKKGFSVQLGDFATVRLTISSGGSDTVEDFSTDLIKGVNTVFTPSKDFKRGLEDIKFEKDKS